MDSSCRRRTECRDSVPYPKNGTLASIKLVTSSGDSDADGSAMRAIAACSPFKSLPTDYPAAYLDLQYTFNYSVDELSEVGGEAH